MHLIYQTECIILSAAPKGESSSYLYIFTEEFGLIGATAQGLRELKSKLRYHLQHLSRVHIELVKGRAGWRIVNVRSGSHRESFAFQSKKEARAVFSRFAGLLVRLLGGEEKNEKLYKTVSVLHDTLTQEDFDHEELLNIEVVGVMRILNFLGYWGEDSVVGERFLNETIGSADFLRAVSPVRPIMIREINKALQETQL